jgi:hypothetical protein
MNPPTGTVIRHQLLIPGAPWWAWAIVIVGCLALMVVFSVGIGMMSSPNEPVRIRIYGAALVVAMTSCAALLFWAHLTTSWVIIT